MPGEHRFEHLPLLLRYQGRARLRGGGRTSPQTVANRNARQAHSNALTGSARALRDIWERQRAVRQQEGVPVIPRGVPILLKVDPSLELDVLRDKFEFEIVAEQEEGYVIVAAEDIELTPFLEMVSGFAVQVHGSARIAQVHRLFDDPDQAERLSRILSERLNEEWPQIAEGQTYVVDVGIGCVGTQEIPARPNRRKRDTDADWANRERDWSQARAEAYVAWDEVKRVREEEIEQLTNFYDAEILHLVDAAPFDAAVLPDSFTVRLKISGRGLKDFALNYPYIFEIVEPDDIALPQQPGITGSSTPPPVTPIAPDDNAPAICVIDSGIQEAHTFISVAIDRDASYCFVPGKGTADVGDFVRPGGHGTRIAGAVLYGETVAKQGAPTLPFWLQNARVLDEDNMMPEVMFPPEVLRAVVERYHLGARHTRIFNHSINANSYCRIRYMSSWAAEIDLLCSVYDVLIIQSAGNLPTEGSRPYLGIKDHLEAGRPYPQYLSESAARIANPAQSLQALTVGSVAYGDYSNAEWRTFAKQVGHPSSFSRTGPGIWDVIKPEVVEFGGDDLHTKDPPVDIRTGGIPAACPELVRSTMFPPGPPYDRDEVGTSYAAPKVARIAGRLQELLPAEPALLFRALIVQSARWPGWAEELFTRLRDPELPEEDRLVLREQATSLLRWIGYGTPNEDRATVNTDHRTTFVTSGESSIKAYECHIYQVPIPIELRRQADEFDIRVDVTLSYVAQPRRTRRNLRRYLSTWVDWKSSRLGESIGTFRARAIKEDEASDQQLPGSVLPWTLHENANFGLIRDTRRNMGTVQKDWAVVKSNTLPDDFCVAVVGHEGWSRDPDSEARYTLAVTFEILGQEIEIYEPLRNAIVELQEIAIEGEAEAEVEVTAD